MENEELINRLLDDTETLATIIQEFENVIQIVFTKTADAIIAASIFARTFYILQKPCILTEYTEDTKQIIEQRSGNLNIFIGIKTDILANLTLKGNNIALLNIGEKEPTFTNIRIEKYAPDTKSFSLSACTYFICSPMPIEVEYIIQLPLVAYQTIAPMSEYTGIHKMIADDATEGEIVNISKSISLLGSGISPITESFVHTLTPFLPGITGNRKKVLQLLTDSNVAIEVKDTERKVSDLSTDEIKSINSKLINVLVKHKGYQEESLRFIKSKTIFVNEEKDTITYNTWDFGTAIQDAIYRNKIQTAIAVLIGDRSNHLRKLQKIYNEERRAVNTSYMFIQDNREQVIELSSFKYFIGDKKISWFMTTDIAAMALSHGLVTPDFPFAVIAPGPENLQTIGIRASKSHRINLTKLISEILEDLKIETKIKGSVLKCQISVEAEQVEKILFEFNDKIKEIIN